MRSPPLMAGGGKDTACRDPPATRWDGARGPGLGRASLVGAQEGFCGRHPCWGRGCLDTLMWLALQLPPSQATRLFPRPPVTVGSVSIC